MLISDIMTRVRAAVGDVNANQFDDATLVAWLNDGIRECAQENMLLQKSATSALVVGTTAYTLPADILKLYSIKVDNALLTILTFSDWQKQNFDSTETGLPVIAYVWAGKYTVWPSPDRAYSVEVNYIYDPVDITNVFNVAPALPSVYHSRLVDYCIAQVALQDDNEQLYSLKMQEFSTGIKKLSDQSETEEAAYPSTMVSPRDMGDGVYDGIEW
jgi:hypothetical protein